MNWDGLIRKARDEVLYGVDMPPGTLVVEMTKFRPDPDGLGFLVGHGIAPYSEDGTGPAREVWDVVPLTLKRGSNGKLYQRWDNAQFLPTSAWTPRWRRWRAWRRFGKALRQERR